MLCDDMGLGKTLQLLSLVLARPAPPGWAVERLPARTEEPCPLKATLVVAPATLLDQWEHEIRVHLRDGALTYCTYTKESGAPRHERRRREQAEAAAALLDEAGRPKRARRAAQRFDVSELGGAGGRSVQAERVAAEMDAQVQPGDSEVLAVTQRAHRFVGPDGGAAPPLETCDLVLVSFETLRDEMRHGKEDSTFSTIGFWRIVLDEAQLVANSTSTAALMCSELWRRHAWVATGTPINAKAEELHGLLTFLALRPFADDVAWQRLLHTGYRARTPGSLARMRALLRAIMLRRSKDDPAVAEQIRVPPLTWETSLLNLSATEQAAYRLAHTQLKDSHRQYARVQAQREAQRERAQANRAEGLPADFQRADGQQRLLGRLMGDLTRVRQMLCHPSVINEQRLEGTANRAALLASGKRQPQAVIMARLVVDAHGRCDADAVRSLRLRVALEVIRARGERTRLKNGGEELRDEILSGAARAMLRLPREERYTLLETSLGRRLRACRDQLQETAPGGSDDSQAAASLAAEVVERVASCARGLSGLADVHSSDVAAHGDVRSLSVHIVQRLDQRVTETEAARLADAEARTLPADDKCLELLRKGPKRWMQAYEELAPLWSSASMADTTEAASTEAAKHGKATKPAKAGKRKASASCKSASGDDRDMVMMAHRILSPGGAEPDAQSGDEVDTRSEQVETRRGAPKLDAIDVRRAEAQAAEAAAKLRESMSSLTYMQGQQVQARTAASADAPGAPGAAGPSDPGASSSAADPIAGVDSAASSSCAAAGSSADVSASERCIICFEDRDQVDDWSITQCMHEGCWECMRDYIVAAGRCPICRVSLQLPQLHRVEATDAPTRDGAEGAGAMEGSHAALREAAASEYGTKVATLLAIVAEACADGGKVVIFSGWTRLLRITAEALSAHSISTASLAGGAEGKRQALRSFRSGAASVLLVPLFGGASGAGGGGAAGLTLTEARTAVLLEPQLQPGIERQAAGRISRIGQKHETRCVRLIMRNTIEPNILQWQEQRLATGVASSAAQLNMSDLDALVGGGR